MSEMVWHEELRGASLGVIFVSVFGFVWSSIGSSAFPEGSTLILLASALVTLVLVCAALYLRRAARFAPAMPQGAMGAAVWRKFQTVGLVEGLAIFAAIFVLVRLQRPELIPAVVALIVGVHFFPLASLFRVRLYHATGLLLCGVFALTVVLAPVSGVFALWFALPGIGCALTLWTTGAVLAALGIKGRRAAPK